VADFRKFAKSLDKGESVLLRTMSSNGDTFFIPMKAPLE
jgi:hypothetical protein